MKRPLEYAWRSQAVFASVIGLRAKATAIAVPSSSDSVCSAASRIGRNGSWFVSGAERSGEAGRFEIGSLCGDGVEPSRETPIDLHARRP